MAQNLVLASQSPYRKQLLEGLGLHFDCVRPNFDEEKYKAQNPSLSPLELCEALAAGKAKSVADAHEDAWVIGSDQLLNLGGEILGKAGSPEKAFEQLKKLSGKSHELITAVSLSHSSEAPRNFTQVTQITLRQLSDEEIRNYIKLDQPLDCAGSYKMEAAGLNLVEAIECDDFSGIVGLPLIRLSQELRQLGISALDISALDGE